MSDDARFTRLPDRVRPEDMVAAQPVLEHGEPLPDQVELDREWVVRWYG
ncbi:hypothetical protein EDD29_2897 [Actinocorallia herbida]|uniref:Uncharacterized protein n=1 Tax=Actinocorallia herbida TaxID=58109 RepID=A0A3N1CVS9_9ACTN|nr:hypothetical protein [Actinocorallia herbida]ROO85354.1 hypothetical protein EDD29_2897 [Actinocorallia herbida]